MKRFHVMCSVKLDNDWDEWAVIPAFSVSLPPDTAPIVVAQRARMIVDRRGDDTVKVQVYNEKSKLYDADFTFERLPF